MNMKMLKNKNTGLRLACAYKMLLKSCVNKK